MIIELACMTHALSTAPEAIRDTTFGVQLCTQYSLGSLIDYYYSSARGAFKHTFDSYIQSQFLARG